jgi:hypothetical protein
MNNSGIGLDQTEQLAGLSDTKFPYKASDEALDAATAMGKEKVDKLTTV